MRIEVHTSGGFAGNVRRPPQVVETGELEPEAARELEALAGALPPAGAPGRGADLMQYRVVVDGHSTTYSEPGVPGEVRSLLRLVRERSQLGG